MIKFIISIFLHFLYSIARSFLVKFQSIMNMITHIFGSLFLIIYARHYFTNDPSLVTNLRKYDIIFTKYYLGI